MDTAPKALVAYTITHTNRYTLDEISEITLSRHISIYL